MRTTFGELTAELFEVLAVGVLIDGGFYRAAPSAFRDEFHVQTGLSSEIVLGSILIDEACVRYRVVQCERLLGGITRLRVRPV